MYRAASTKGQLKNVEGELVKLESQLELESRGRHILKSPLYSNIQKTNFFNSIAQKSNLSPLTQHFIDLVSQGGRLGYIPSIIQVFKSVSESRNMKSNVVVTSSKVIFIVFTFQAISKQDQERLIATIRNRFADQGNILKFSFKVYLFFSDDI